MRIVGSIWGSSYSKNRPCMATSIYKGHGFAKLVSYCWY